MGGRKRQGCDVKHITGREETNPDGMHRIHISMDTRTNSMNRFANEENIQTTRGKLSLGRNPLSRDLQSTPAMTFSA